MPRASGSRVLIEASELAGELERVTVLDARWELGGPPGRDAYLEGHIPGAAFVDLETELVEADGRYREPPPIEREPVGVYCGSGVAAAQVVLGLAAAGRPAALYVGSWSEWITDPRRPVATGASG